MKRSSFLFICGLLTIVFLNMILGETRPTPVLAQVTALQTSNARFPKNPKGRWGVYVNVVAGTVAAGTKVAQLQEWAKAVPSAWKNTNKTRAAYELVVAGKREVVGNCKVQLSATGKSVTVALEQTSAIVTLRDLNSGQVIAEQTFSGGAAPTSCPPTIKFQSGQIGIEGAPPDMVEFREWLLATLTQVDPTLPTITPTP